MLRLLTVTALCATLAAQDKTSSLRFVPKDSVVVARVAAPLVWQQRFAKTQFVKLLHTNTLGQLVDQVSTAIGAGLDQLRDSGKFDADLIEKLLSDYRGELVWSMQVDWEGVANAIRDGGVPPLTCVLALTPDDSFDLAALASALDHLIETEGDNPEPIRDLVVGDHRLRVGGDDQMQATLPAMIDGHLVMLIGTDLEQQAGRLLANQDRFEGLDGEAPLMVKARLDPLAKTLLDLIIGEMRADVEPPFDVAEMADLLGLLSLDDFELAVDAKDKFVAIDYEIGLNDQEPGLFSWFAFDPAPSKLLRMVPPAARQFGVTPLDFAAIYATIENAWRCVGDSVPISFDEAMQLATEALKVRIKEDLIDHLGTEFLFIQDTEAMLAGMDSGADDFDAAVGGGCLCIALRDGKAFGESLETALRSRGLHASRKSEDYAGVKIYSLALGGIFELEYSVTDDLLLVAAGKSEGPRRNLRGVLDARAAGADTEAVPSVVQPYLEHLPAGWAGLGVTSMAAALDRRALEDALREVDSDVPPEMTMFFDVIDQLGGDLQRLGMESIVSASYHSPRKLAGRALW